MCTPGLRCVSGPICEVTYQWDASSRSCMDRTDGSSQASWLAGNLYMDLDNGTYLYSVLVCSLAHLMFCLRLWMLSEILPASLSLHPCESGSCDAQPRPWVWTRLVDLYGGQLNVKTSQLAMHAQCKIQSENIINGFCHFSKGYLIRIKFCGIFQDSPF